MLKYMLDQSDEDPAFLSVSSSDETVLLINNLGGVSVLEMGGITSEIVSQLNNDYGIHPVHIIAGTFMTSLNSLSFSIGILKLQEIGLKYSILELLDAPAACTGWAAAIKSSTGPNPPTQTREKRAGAGVDNKPCGLQMDSQLAIRALKHALQKLIDVEPEITKYDTIVGDGDCGTGLKRGAEGILSNLRDDEDAALFLDNIISAVGEKMDGTSGAIYAIFLNALAHGLRAQANSGAKKLDAQIWAKALLTALESMRKYTPATPGDRTLVDALAPFVDELDSTGDVHKAAQAAEEGAKKTKGMKASLGRTVYVGGSGFEQVPDPGGVRFGDVLEGFGGAVEACEDWPGQLRSLVVKGIYLFYLAVASALRED